MADIIIKILIFFIFLILIFNLSLKLFDGKNDLIDGILMAVRYLVDLIKKCYRYIIAKIK